MRAAHLPSRQSTEESGLELELNRVVLRGELDDHGDAHVRELGQSVDVVLAAVDVAV